MYAFLSMDIGTSLRQTRKSIGLTQSDLAALAGVSRPALINLENGAGHMTTLSKITPHIAFRIVGLASGDCPSVQIRSARLRRKMSQADLASKAKVSVPTIRAVERNVGSIKSMAAIIAVLAPNASAAAHTRAHWQIKKDVRLTPPDLVDAVVEAFGPISIDPASDPNGFVDAEIYLTETEDGLVTPWSGRLAFVNPPYSDLTQWIGRCADAYENNEVEIVIGLFPARTETTTFRNRVFGKADVLLLPRRLSFYDENRTKLPPAPFALMMCIWGAPKDRVERFVDLSESLVIWSENNRTP